MAAHRFWRLVFGYNNASARVAVAEMAMRATAGGANLCVGGSTIAVASDGTNVAARAFDGDGGTFYRSGTTPTVAWLGYEFPSPVAIAEMAWTNTGDATAHANSAVPQWSDEGYTWFFASPGIAASEAAGATNTVTGISELPFTTTAVGGVVRPDASWPAGAPSARPVGGFTRHDTVDGGPYRVAGTVAIDGTPTTPVRRRVRLFHRLSGRLVREVWSAEDGAFEFTKIAAGEYVVMSDDYTRTYNAVVADAVMAVP